jgi:hypothetical protein
VTSRPSPESVVRRQRWWALALVAVAAVWVLVNGPVEGRVLLVLTPTHGLTVADLPALAALVVAGALFVRSVSSRRGVSTDQRIESH